MIALSSELSGLLIFLRDTQILPRDKGLHVKNEMATSGWCLLDICFHRHFVDAFERNFLSNLDATKILDKGCSGIKSQTLIRLMRITFTFSKMIEAFIS